MDKETTLHPGEFLMEAYIKPSGLSLNETALKMGVSGATLSRLTSKKSSMSVDMARKLEGVFKRKAKSWLLMQVNYDLANE